MQEANLTAIAIHHDGLEVRSATPRSMAELAGETFPIHERVPEADGEAFDWGGWYEAWRRTNDLEHGPRPTHLKVEAADGFEATMPWEQLANAAVLYASGGASLMKGGPIRIYVPSGTSKCLNVKSVVTLRILYQPERGGEAEYGFKNVFNPSELIRPKPGSSRSNGQ
jgi:hypothetical protein